MSKYLKTKKPSSTQSTTSETTSHGTSDSTRIGLDLNEEATDSGDEEVEEVRPVGRDMAKKMGSSSSSRAASSAASDPSLVDALLSKFIQFATSLFSSRKESSSGYLRIKEREFEMQDQRRREEAEFERPKLAQTLDLSRLATTLNRLERSIQIGINKWYQSLLRNSETKTLQLQTFTFQIYSMAGSDDEIPPPPPLPPQTPTQQAPHTVSTIKLPILKKGEYDIWAMKIEHYLSHTDYPIWEVIQKGNGPDDCSESSRVNLRFLVTGVSTEDANQKFLRSLHSSWSQVSLVMRTKPGVCTDVRLWMNKWNFALMAYSNSGSDTEVTSYSKECVESYAKHKKLYDEQREQLGDASIEIQAYTQALKKVEAQLVTHQKNQLLKPKRSFKVQVNPQSALKNMGIVVVDVPGTDGKQAYLAGYKTINGGPVVLEPVRSEEFKLTIKYLLDPKEANHSACTQDNIDVGNPEMESESAQDYFVLPIWSSYTLTAKSSEAKNEGEKPNKNTGLKTNEEPVDQEDQAFLEELERLKRQENEANDAAEALRKEFAQDTEDLLLQAKRC
ncbi:hypothetical protein Tco_0089294 [Tanacetum coccineum]